MRSPVCSYRKNVRRRSGGGVTLVEVSVASTVLALLLANALGVVSLVDRARDKTEVEAGQTGGARLAVDQVLSELRAADRVLASGAVSGLTYATSASAGAGAVVLRAPAFHPSSPDVFTGGADLIAFRYDASTRTLRESVEPATGSVRPARRERVLARNVAGLDLVYYAREQFRNADSGGNVRFTLSADPVGTPAVYVNGSPSTCSYNPSTRVASMSIGSRGNDVQFVYQVDPAANSGAAAPLVAEVTVRLRLSEGDSRNVTRTLALDGAARLRNRRI